MRIISRFALFIAFLFFIGLCVVAIISMLALSWDTAWGAEYEIGWSSVTTDVTGAPLDTIPYYEIYRDGILIAETRDTTATAYSDSTDRSHYHVLACCRGYNCSVPSPSVSARIVDVLPGFTHEMVYDYIAPGELLVIRHPHILDELQITYTDSIESLYWHSYLDFDNSGWIDLSDVAEFGQLWIQSHFTMDWFMFRFGGGDVNIADLLVLGELLHGPAWRRMEFEKWD